MSQPCQRRGKKERERVRSTHRLLGVLERLRRVCGLLHVEALLLEVSLQAAANKEGLVGFELHITISPPLPGRTSWLSYCFFWRSTRKARCLTEFLAGPSLRGGLAMM